ncbi:hypothetical protein [Mesorhizobium sp. Root102]|uniref:hypothetical protein n=1 Tax=Mesorhizobium sp. Root102 TaxID=1736422 RepID=UPI000B16F357|nr:hypothetical protein [Mesorhizobium sp. Root102]
MKEFPNPGEIMRHLHFVVESRKGQTLRESTCLKCRRGSVRRKARRENPAALKGEPREMYPAGIDPALVAVHEF